ncbi:MAG: HAMP domain-containing histidine kinase [Candidatus Wallbacteria bacterium]|nr:HAMP domain-containing histidine kinase [Candidatus Wallbacteria bacterium]
MRRSLYWKLVRTLLAVLLFSTVLNGLFVAFTAKGVARKTQEATLGRFARYVSRTVGYALSTGARQRHLPDLLRAAVQEFPQVQIAFNPVKGPTVGTPDAESALLEAAERGEFGLVPLGRWPRRAAVAPVWVKGRPAGTVAVAVSQSQAAGMVAVIGWTGILMFPLLFVLSAILGLLALRHLRQRLGPVSAVLARIRSGDLSARLPHEEVDEVGQVFVAFNEMVERVQGTVNRLAQVDRRRRDFLVEVAHELKTPLAAVEGSLEVMMMQPAADAAPAGDPARQRHLERAYGEAVRIRGLVADLLESARMEEPRYSLALAPASLQRLLTRVLERYSLVFERRGILVRTRFSEQPIVLALDERRMEQVFGNLLQNTLDHTGAGCALEVSSRLEGRLALAELRDDGDGMSIERLEAVRGGDVVPLSPVPQGRDKPEISGVGLAIVRKLVALHGGTLSVESAPGSGTRIVIALPLEHGSREPDPS